MATRLPTWALATALVITGCAQASTTDSTAGSTASRRTVPGSNMPATAATVPAPTRASPTVAPSPSTTPPGWALYACGTLVLSPDELEHAPPATQLGADGRAALEGVEVPIIDPAEGWRVVVEGPDQVSLLRGLEPADADAVTDAGTHEVLTVAWFPDVNGEGPGWHLEESGTCRLRRELPDGLEAADLVLDPDHPLDPTADVVHLLAIERECASGEVATGRLEVVVQDLTEDQLRLLVGIRPVSGAAECPGNPPTPFTVELGEPLGDRVPVDLALSPPRPIPPASELSDFPD